MAFGVRRAPPKAPDTEPRPAIPYNMCGQDPDRRSRPGRLVLLLSNMAWTTPEGWLRPVACALFALGGLYLFRINRLLKSTPDEIRKLTGPRWVPEQLRAIYDKLDNEPIQYNDQLPLKLDRRYIVTGGNGEPKLIILIDPC